MEAKMSRLSRLFRQGQKLKLRFYDANVNAPIQPNGFKPISTVIEGFPTSSKIDKGGSFRLLPTVQRWRDQNDHQDEGGFHFAAPAAVVATATAAGMEEVEEENELFNTR